VTRRLWAIGCVVLLLTGGCGQKPRKSEYRFVEDVFVQGVCSEDHTTVSGNYQGEIVHWDKVGTQTHSRFGSVFNLDSLDVEKMYKHIKNPSQYVPPFGIAFSNLSETDIARSQFTLHGLSEHDDDHGGGLNATCELTVTKRFDHLPTAQERAAMARQRTTPDPGRPRTYGPST
jgi:hypothetical protein